MEDGILGSQFKAIKNIPGQVISYWPAWFTFSAVHYLERLILGLIPLTGGTVGMLEAAAISGMTTTVNMVTWDEVVKANTIANNGMQSMWFSSKDGNQGTTASASKGYGQVMP